MLVNWIYTLELECDYCSSRRYKTSSKTRDDPMHLLQWVYFYVLTDRICIGGDVLRDNMFCQLECCMDDSKLKITPEAVAFLCENTPEDDFGLREMLIDHIERSFFSKKFDAIDLGKALAANETFNNDVMKRIRGHLPKKKEECDFEACISHEHPSG